MVDSFYLQWNNLQSNLSKIELTDLFMLYNKILELYNSHPNSEVYYTD